MKRTFLNKNEIKIDDELKLKDFEDFRQRFCLNCTFDYFCKTDCAEIEKAKRIPFSIIQKFFIESGGEISEVYKKILRWKK